MRGANFSSNDDPVGALHFRVDGDSDADHLNHLKMTVGGKKILDK